MSDRPIIDDLVDEPRPIEEFIERINRPLEPQEISDAKALSAWFVRRYPTVQQRFEFIRRRHREWTTAIFRKHPR
jgi:hypothetical protein